MNYSKAIYLMSGEVITITADEERSIKSHITQGSEWINIQGEMINIKAIAKIGNHHATAYMENLEKYQEKTDLKLGEIKNNLLK